MDRLIEWMRTNKVSAAELSRRLGKSRWVVGTYLRGEATMDLETARRIHDETDGFVTPNHLCGLEVHSGAAA